MVERRAYGPIVGTARTGLAVVATALAVGSGVVLGTIVGAAPAAADVTVTPAQAVQGDPARLTFRVTEERPGAHTTRIQLRFPDATPIAEIWPMSVRDWAPQITMRKLDQPLPGLHHGSTTEVVSAITWIRATPAGDDPQPAELSISLGPMPTQGDRMTFTVVQTYSDGFVANWDGEAGAEPARPAPVVTLVPPSGGGPAAGDAAPPADAAEPAAEGEDGGLGLLDMTLAGALLVAVAIAGWYLFRDRRGVADLPADAADSPAATAGPGTPAVPDPAMSGAAGPTTPPPHSSS
nr:YcnI family protein [Micromonospora sp. DSM 115978]